MNDAMSESINFWIHSLTFGTGSVRPGMRGDEKMNPPIGSAAIALSHAFFAAAAASSAAFFAAEVAARRAGDEAVIIAKAKADAPPPVAGDIVTIGEALYRIVDVTPRLTPFRKKDQYTKLEGYTLTLRRLPGLVGKVS